MIDKYGKYCMSFMTDIEIGKLLLKKPPSFKHDPLNPSESYPNAKIPSKNFDNIV